MHIQAYKQAAVVSVLSNRGWWQYVKRLADVRRGKVNHMHCFLIDAQRGAVSCLRCNKLHAQQLVAWVHCVNFRLTCVCARRK
jgi:hypothetical protein